MCVTVVCGCWLVVLALAVVVVGGGGGGPTPPPSHVWSNTLHRLSQASTPTPAWYDKLRRTRQPIIPGPQPRATLCRSVTAHRARGSAATDKPRASTTSCAIESCDATEIRCVARRFVEVPFHVAPRPSPRPQQRTDLAHGTRLAVQLTTTLPRASWAV